MRKIVNISGNKYGLLTALSFSHIASNEKGYKYYLWNCVCECGVEKKVAANLLKSGQTKSCGCLNSGENISLRKTTHNLSGTPIYTRWNNMKRRCHYEKSDQYRWYGARGISVCQRWRNSIEDFISDMGYPPTDQHTIDRIDNNGNYEPSNCRWATKKEQANNRRPRAKKTSLLT